MLALQAGTMAPSVFNLDCRDQIGSSYLQGYRLSHFPSDFSPSFQFLVRPASLGNSASCSYSSPVSAIGVLQQHLCVKDISHTGGSLGPSTNCTRHLSESCVSKCGHFLTLGKPTHVGEWNIIQPIKSPITPLLSVPQPLRSLEALDLRTHSMRCVLALGALWGNTELGRT